MRWEVTVNLGELDYRPSQWRRILAISPLQIVFTVPAKVTPFIVDPEPDEDYK